MRRLGFVQIPEGAPAEFRIWSFGTVRFEWEGGVALDFIFTPEDAAEVLRRATQRWANRLPIDYEHNTQMPVANGPIPAAGWFSIEVREDGLWAVNVEWTATASQMLDNREYRFFSPVFYDEENHIRQLDMLALTNRPATVGLEPLVATTTGGKVDRNRLIALLGLNADATDDQIEAAITNSRTQAAQATETLSALDINPAQPALASARIADLRQVDTLRQQVCELSAQLASVQSQASETEATAVVETALTEGRITLPEREHWLSEARRNLAGTRAYLASKPRMVPVNVRIADTTPPPTPADNLTEADQAVMKRLGLSKDQFLASRKRLAERSN